MNERKYYDINEKNAALAHSMMSMSDYVENSVTNLYRKEVDDVYDLADKVAKEKPEKEEEVYRLAERYAKYLAYYYNKKSSIDMMCPSILISGAGNFPVKKKEKQVAAWDRNHWFYRAVQATKERIETILYSKETIKSDDEKAIEKLEEKLKDLKEQQELMKASNKALRLKDVEKGNDRLRELGYDENHIKMLRSPDFCGRTGYASYKLTNNNAEIHRIEDRIKSIKATKERGTSEQEFETFKAVENTEAMRYQIIFDGKPEADVRTLLKSNGFKWTPSQGVWQRQITANGKWAFNRVIEKLKEMEVE